MNLNFEILQFFVYKHVVRKKDFKSILDECERLKMPVERYLLAQNMCTEITALDALGEFFEMPYIQMDMLEVDKELLERFDLSFLRAKKIVPVTIDVGGSLIVACGRPLDFASTSVVSSVYSGHVEYVLVPPTQIDVFIDGEIAIRSTAVALNNIKDRKSVV